MIVSLSASLILMALLLLLGMAYSDDHAAWPSIYKKRIKYVKRNITLKLLISAINSSGIFYRIFLFAILLFFIWLLTCVLFVAFHMFSGLYEMLSSPAKATLLGMIFIAIVSFFIISVYVIVIYGLLLHISLYPLALGATWARRGGSDKRFVTLLSLACAAAGLLVRVSSA